MKQNSLKVKFQKKYLNQLNDNQSVESLPVIQNQTDSINQVAALASIRKKTINNELKTESVPLRTPGYALIDLVSGFSQALNTFGIFRALLLYPCYIFSGPLEHFKIIQTPFYLLAFIVLVLKEAPCKSRVIEYGNRRN